jgi:AhpD family alkylhydroperoxidase
MQPRLNFSKVSPDVAKAMPGLEACIARGSIERPLIELVKMRASQINGCTYCLDMHSKVARAAPSPVPISRLGSQA